MAKTHYWNIRNILSKGCLYNIVYGERSNGKTYGCLQYGLEEYFKNGSEIAIIRRMEEDFRGKRANQLFSPLIKNGVIERLSKGKYNSIKYYSQRWYLQHIEEKKENCYTDELPFAYAFALTSMEHDKSSSYPNIRTIIFDEFITRVMYLNDEFITFQNTLSTIIRDRNDVLIFMLGNSINKYGCPYFKEMGITNFKKQEQGTIDIYTYGDSGLRVAVEFCGDQKKKVEKKSDIYFAFNNPKLQMITKGSWEMDIYPHLPTKYKHKEIKYMYFIVFDNETLQCEIIKTKFIDDNEEERTVMFTYIHRKTTKINDTKGKYIVYQQDFSPLPNYRRRITIASNPLEKWILSFYRQDKVFYQDNDIGEIVRNYLQWSA